MKEKIKSHNWFVVYTILYSDEINSKHIHKILKNKNKSTCEYASLHDKVDYKNANRALKNRYKEIRHNIIYKIIFKND